MDYKKIWNKTKKSLKQVLPEHGYEAWIETLSPVGATNNIFILEAPNQFAHDWIVNNYQDLIVSSLREHEKKLELRVAIAPQSQQNVVATSLANSEPVKQSNTGRRHNINVGNTFESFIEGPNSVFAKNAALNVSKNPGSSDFNPLIIYGGVGLGKTHLLHSIANTLIRGKKQLNVVLASSTDMRLGSRHCLQLGQQITYLY